MTIRVGEALPALPFILFDNQTVEQQYGYKKTFHFWKVFGGPDGTRTRDLLRDRQAF